MSNTRTAAAGADPDQSNERYLASAKLRGISLGMNIVTRVASCRPPRERAAMIWLTNYALGEALTADALSTELDLSKSDIRSALTDPEADLSRFTRQVEALRAGYEAALVKPVATKVQRTVSSAVKFAATNSKPVEIVGKTRMGKTASGRYEYALLMHRAVWFEPPSDDQDRTFFFDLAKTLGIGTGGGKKTGQLRAQIKACFGRRQIDLLIVDEGHRLWPTSLSTKPRRLEFLRELHDSCGIAVVILATPQFTESLTLAMNDNPRWAPGQWDGRVVRFHLDDAMTEADLEAVARRYAPGASAAVISRLVLQAKATEGYCGAMVNTISLATHNADGGALTEELVAAAQHQMARGSRTALLAKQIAGKARRAA